MNNTTRARFASMIAVMATKYGVAAVDKQFAATPTIEQTLADRVIEESQVLQLINFIPVTEQEGQTILGSAGGMSKRTDTQAGPRITRNLLSLDPLGYRCEKTEFDINIGYALLDAWAKFTDFESRILKYTRQAIADARVTVGWHGIAAAAVTDPDTNTLGEDVNIGWLQKIRAYNSGAQFMSEGVAASGVINLGAGGDYVNLDAFVYDLSLRLGERQRNNPRNVVLLGRELVAFDKTALYTAQGDTPTEKEKIVANAAVPTYGGLPASSPGFFPARGIYVGPWSNLSLYYQTGSVRQKINDNAEYDRIDHFNTVNDAYVVEDYEACASAEFANIKLWDGAAFT